MTAPEATDTDDLRSVGEAARQLGVSIDTLRRWERAGKITGVRTPTNHRRFPQSEIDRIKEAS